MLDEIKLEAFSKTAKGERLKRSLTARRKRRVNKYLKELHAFKEEREARDRLRAERMLSKQE